MRLTIAALIAGLLLSSFPLPLRDSPADQHHDGLFQPESGAEVDDHAGELAFFHAKSDEGPVYILADVAVDEEFVSYASDGWLAEVQRILDGTNALLGMVDLEVKAGSIQHWRSDDDVYFISSHLKSAEEQVWRVPGHLFIAIIGQETVRDDGFVWESGSRLIVQFYPEDRKRIYGLIAHEMGHLMGAHHHDGEEECTEDGCIMDRSGYAHSTSWCQHHRQIIQDNVASRLAAQAS